MIPASAAPSGETGRQAVAEARLQGLAPFCLTVDREAPAYLPCRSNVPSPDRSKRKHASTPARSGCSGPQASPGPSNARGGADRRSGKGTVSVAWPAGPPVSRTS
jgi:hypothetical protein